MALHLDPQTPVAQVIGGTTYLVRVLTQREWARFAIHSDAIRARIRSARTGEPAVLDEDDIRRIERCLCLGIAGWEVAPGAPFPAWRCDAEGPRHMDPALLDTIPFDRWMELYLAIVRANRVTEDDAGNSPSPRQ